jgi:hypothetical protein
MRALMLTLAMLAVGVEKKMIDFESDEHMKPPKGFEFGRTGQGKPGDWKVIVREDAPSGKQVLAQLEKDPTDYRFPIAYTGPAMKDLRVSVRCWADSGKIDQGCGVIFRVKDADNYYVARANALEDNVRLYRVVKGNRQQFGGWNGKVASHVWHELAVEAKGDHFTVFFNGQKVIDERDSTFTEPGGFGVWTKADSVIFFDDLTATPL